MANKKFNEDALNKIVGGMTTDQETGKRKVGRPRTITDIKEKSSEDGLQHEYTRATFIVRKDLLEKLKGYAFLQNETLKDIVNEMLEEYLKDKRNVREELKGGE